MLDQILTLLMSNIQLITTGLIFAAVFLEFVHIGQTSRINRRLKRAGLWLQKYLNTVFREDAYEETEQAENKLEEEADIRTAGRTDTKERETVQLSAARPVKSRQEEDMRVALAHKKEKKEEDLLDTVLQEIFD